MTPQQLVGLLLLLADLRNQIGDLITENRELLQANTEMRARLDASEVQDRDQD